MDPTPGKSRRPSSKTGAIPRIDLEPQVQHEPPPPPTLPEFDDDGQSVTGILPRYVEEGEDEAKQADDSPSTPLTQSK